MESRVSTTNLADPARSVAGTITHAVPGGNADGVKVAVRAALQSGRNNLTEPVVKSLLANIGICVPRGALVSGRVEVDAALIDLRWPVATKIVSPEIIHKSDINGVRLNLATADNVKSAIDELLEVGRQVHLDGILVEEMVSGGCEMVVGALNDPCFGPMIMVGMGGIHVEIYRDVVYRICPITREEAAAMLDELPSSRLLDGYRGAPPVCRAALLDILLKLGGRNGFLIQHTHEIREVDLNPVIVSAEGAVVADATIIIRNDGWHAPRVGADDDDSRIAKSGREFKALFEPESVAVVGASGIGGNAANTFIRRLQAYGFRGPIYPIHPTSTTLEGLPVYRSLAEMPEPVDYAYIAVSADRVPGLILAAPGRMKFAQVVAAGFGETRGGKKLQRDLIVAARESGCRVLGPNCLGTYSPRGRLTFPVDAPRETGVVGVMTQSGGLGTDIIKRGQSRGLKFSGLVSIGNSADVKPADLLAFYLADPQTQIIGAYLEDLSFGREFFDLMRACRQSKPVVIMKGGRSPQGLTAAASHTGALAGNDAGLEALCEQTPTVLASHLDEFIDLLLVLELLQPRPERPVQRVALFGNGGGVSVLAADLLAKEGIIVTPFSDPVQRRLEALLLPAGTSITNPIDAPVRSLQQDDGHIARQILQIVIESHEVDVLVMHINLAAFVGREGIDPVENLMAAAVSARESSGENTRLALVLRSDGSKALDDLRRRYRAAAIDSRIPMFDELAPLATALGGVRRMERRLASVQKTMRALRETRNAMSKE